MTKNMHNIMHREMVYYLYFNIFGIRIKVKVDNQIKVLLVNVGTLDISYISVWFGKVNISFR